MVEWESFIPQKIKEAIRLQRRMEWLTILQTFLRCAYEFSAGWLVQEYRLLSIYS